MDASKILEKATNPLTAFDFFGYLAPGGTLLLLMYLFETWARALDGKLEVAQLHTPVWTASRMLRPGHDDWVLSAVFVVVLIALSYITGHIVASVASVAIDRTLVAKGYGYPFIALLALDENPLRTTPVAKVFYRGLFFWLNAYLLLRYAAMFLQGAGHRLGSAVWPEVGARIVGDLLVVFIVMKVVASFRYAPPTSLRRRFLEWKFPHWIEKASCWSLSHLFVPPFDLTASFLSRYLLTREPLSTALQKKYRSLFEKRFGMKPEEVDTENFWFSYMYLREKSSTLSGVAQNWLQLYSFSRNLSASFYLFFLYGFLWVGTHIAKIAAWSDYRVGVLLAAPLLGFLLAVIMLTRFYYLYASYFTKFIFRAFVFLAQAPAPQTPPSQAPEEGKACALPQE